MNQIYSVARSEPRWWSDLGAASRAAGLRGAMRGHSDLDAANLQSLAIVGAAPEGRRLARICKARGIRIDTIVDDDPAKAKLAVEETQVALVQTLTELPKSTPIIIASHRVLRVTQRLRNLGFRTVVPFAMLQVLAPDIFPPHMFYDGLLDDLWTYRAEYQALHGRLADDRSRQVLDAVIGFRRTLDAAALQPAVTEHDLYAPEGLFEFADN